MRQLLFIGILFSLCRGVLTYFLWKKYQNHRSFADWNFKEIPASASPRRLFAGCSANLYYVTQMLFLFLCKQVLFFISCIMLKKLYLLEDRQAGRERPTALTCHHLRLNSCFLCPSVIPFDRLKSKRSNSVRHLMFLLCTKTIQC